MVALDFCRDITPYLHSFNSGPTNYSFHYSRPFDTMDEFTELHQQIGKATLSILSVFSKSSRVQSITKNKSYVLDKVSSNGKGNKSSGSQSSCMIAVIQTDFLNIYNLCRIFIIKLIINIIVIL